MNLKLFSQDFRNITENNIDDEMNLEEDDVSEEDIIVDRIVNDKQEKHWFKCEVCMYKFKKEKHLNI